MTREEAYRKWMLVKRLRMWAQDWPCYRHYEDLCGKYAYLELVS